MRTFKAFTETKARFMEATGISAPITYEQWLVLPDEHKAVALYINFFAEITLAWTKAEAEFVEEDDAVSIILQYLMKNVPIITANPKKYTGSYIYRVAYNCMGCLRRVKSESFRYYNTISNYQTDVEDREINIFDNIEDESDPYIHLAADILASIYEELDKDTKSVINNILNGKKLTNKAKERESDIYAYLRKVFAKVADQYLVPKLLCETFSDVLKYDTLIDSAVVVMRDGVKAIYCGEKRVATNGKTDIVFMGPTQDYIIPASATYDLKVVDVQMYE